MTAKEWKVVFDEALAWADRQEKEREWEPEAHQAWFTAGCVVAALSTGLDALIEMGGGADR